MHAVKQLLTALNGGKVPHRAAVVVDRRSSNSGHTICGFDHTNDTAWEQARAGVLPYLPTELRKLSAVELGELVADYRLARAVCRRHRTSPRWTTTTLNGESCAGFGEAGRNIVRSSLVSDQLASALGQAW